MDAFKREEMQADMFWNLTTIRDMCRRQRVMLVLEREHVILRRDLRHTKARLELKENIRKESEKRLETVVKPLIESVNRG
jgi:hypothetical protein